MYTIEQVAEQIELLQPDLTNFFESINREDSQTIIAHLQGTSNVFLRLLKTEVTAMLHSTHANKSIWSMQNTLNQILKADLVNHGLSNSSSSYGNFSNYTIRDSLNPACHITAHLKDPKPYLPKYLWDKIRVKRKLKTEAIKQLQPNEMSLKIFQKYLSTLKKPLSSVDAREYLEQLIDRSFTEIRQDFIEVIFEKCTKPSVELQKDLSLTWQVGLPVLPNQEHTIISRYMTLSKNHIRNLASNLNVPVSSCIYDSRDSEYKPFITNMYRAPDKTMQEVSYLFNVILLLQVSISKTPNPVYEYFIEHIIKHLATSESAKLVMELKKSFTLTNEAFNKFTI